MQVFIKLCRQSNEIDKFKFFHFNMAYCKIYLQFTVFKKSHGAYKWSHYNCQIWYMVMPQIFFPKLDQNFETNSNEITTVSIFFWICFYI